MTEPDLTIALAGNPNCGKTSIFNALTRSRQKVGNYPGVTVERIEGVARYDGRDVHVIDLPGTYSLTAYSDDEIVARNFILEQGPDVLVNIVDASNLERHLYLTTQLLELGVPIVLALNMSDIARSRGFRIDVEKLSRLLGVPIVSTVGSRREGVDELLSKAVEVAGNPQEHLARLRRPNYGREVEPHVRQLTDCIARFGIDRPRWTAIKLLEDDSVVRQRIESDVSDRAQEILRESKKLRRHLGDICGDPAEIILADRRYGYISGACTEAVCQPVEQRHTMSDQIDRVLTHPVLGLPIFALAMYLVFQLTFWVGNPLVDGLDWLIHEQLSGRLGEIWSPTTAPLLRSLLLDGVVGGVGSVLVFVPLIVLLFLGVAMLEDTGYMARAAFIMDRLMHKIGLHGKSFVPMLIGFGCTVPGILATRSLDTRRDRLTTILVLPLMSCGARLPIYMLIIPAFFPLPWQTPILWAIYLIGIVVAIVMARIFRATLFPGQAAPFVMELPPYRMPTAKGLILHMAERTWMYVRKAGTIILLASILLWAISTFPRPTPAEPEQTVVQAETSSEGEATEVLQNRRRLRHSVAGRIGRGIEPVLRPMGFDWKIGTALIGAFAAKEIFVSQLGIVYAVGEGEGQSEELRDQLRRDYTPLVGFCICLFMLISMPCVATFAVTVREAGGWRWGLLMLGYLTALAWLLTTATYQVGRWVV